MAGSLAPRLGRRSDHRRSIAIACTLVIHGVLAIGLDLVGVYGKQRRRELAPTVQLVDVEVPLPSAPPPPRPPAPPPPVTAPPAPVLAKAPPSPRATSRAPSPRAAVTATEPASSATSPPATTDTAAPGGAPTVSLPSAPPSAYGVAVRRGATTTGPIGRGGSGGGTGTGTGTGSAAGSPPLSIAMIKTQALPKGDYSYFDARKDYPDEAKRLGIEGKVRVRLTVSDAGRVTAAILISKLGHGLDEIALKQAARLEFTPAKDTSDRPVSSYVVWTFTFTLPSSP